MFSRMSMSSGLVRKCQNRLSNGGQIKQNFICKRGSGHNTMDIVPSSHVTKFANNWEHFYVLLTAIPMAVITTIVNIRANPVLIEQPEGYQPRHWEYFKHPISRFLAKYLYDNQEKEWEMESALMEMASQERIIHGIQNKVENTIKFYSDHRSMYFTPHFGEYHRYGREQSYLQKEKTCPNILTYDGVFDKDAKAVPYQGYVDPKDRV